MRKEKTEDSLDSHTETFFDDRGNLLCRVYRREIIDKTSSVNFLTPDHDTLQVGILVHPAGKVLRTHAHNSEVIYDVDTTQELLYVIKGKVRVNILDDTFEFVDDIQLESGDIYHHIRGTHGFEMLEDSQILEIKQGPFPGDDLAKIYKD